MISAQILDTLGTIDERYIAEYQAQKSSRSVNFNAIRWLVIAACLLVALPLLAWPIVNHIRGTGGSAGSSYGYLSYYVDYDKFLELMPDDTPLVGLTENDYTTMEFEVTYSEAFTGKVPSDLTTEDCHSIRVAVSKTVSGVELYAEIDCMLQSPLETVSNYVDTMEVSFPKDATETIRIGDIPVYFTFQSLNDDGEISAYGAAFQVGDVIYDVAICDYDGTSPYQVNREVALEFLTELLK